MGTQTEATLPKGAPTYAFRLSRWKKAERVASLDPDALVVADGESARRVTLDNIASIRLFMSQAGTGTNVYYCEVTPRTGAKVLLRSTSAVGRGQAEDRAVAYRSFVTALVERAAAASPRVAFIAGPTPRAIWLMALVALIAIVPILLLCIVAMLVDRSLTTSGIPFLALMVINLPLTCLIVSRGPPHPFDASRIDAAMLPAAAPAR